MPRIVTGRPGYKILETAKRLCTLPQVNTPRIEDYSIFEFKANNCYFIWQQILLRKDLTKYKSKHENIWKYNSAKIYRLKP